MNQMTLARLHAHKPLELPSLDGNNFQNVDFAGIDLTGMDLRGLYFSYCNFSCAQFEKANLEDVYMHRCMFMGANFTQANMYGCNLSSSILDDAILHKADLSKANLTFVSAVETDFSGARFNDAVLYPMLFHKTKFKDAELDYKQIIGYDNTPQGECIGYIVLYNFRILEVKIPANANRCMILGHSKRAFRVDRMIPIRQFEYDGKEMKYKADFPQGEVTFDPKFSGDFRDNTVDGIIVFPTLEEAMRYA